MMGYWGNMMGYGGGSGMLFAGLFGWMWLIVWTINSILVMLVLLRLYERLSKKK